MSINLLRRSRPDERADASRSGRARPSRRERATWAAACAGTGIVLALSLPPVGWWPLGFVGIIGLDRLLADRPPRSRFWRGFGVAIGLFVPTLWWIHDLTLPGYFVAVIAYSAMFGLCLMICPPGPGRRVALAGAWVLAEVWKGAWPFGGVPISNLAIGQAGGPFAPTVRLFGMSFLSLLVVVGGVGLSSLIARRWLTGAAALAVVAIAVAGAAIAPRGHDVGTPLRVALVQGGGPQGTRAINTDMTKVFARQMQASAKIKTPVDLVVWPEDVVDVNGGPGGAVIDEGVDITNSDKGASLSKLARRLHTTLVAGVVQDLGQTKFLNFAGAWDPQGRLVDRYEKVHRVPFGEYVPLRSLIQHFAGPSLTARDAVIGKGPAVLNTPVGRFGVSISWEIFFSHRARSAIRAGGEVLLNPTNGSTYTGTLIQTQQVASSRLRALEEGRWTLQVAPTGFSAIVTPSGHVVARTSISEQAVLQSDAVHRRTGFTIYNHVGEWPVLGGIVVLILVGWWVEVRARRRGAADGDAAAGDLPRGNVEPSRTASTARAPIAEPAGSHHSTPTAHP